MIPCIRRLFLYFLLPAILLAACTGSDKQAPQSGAGAPIIINNKRALTPAERQNTYADVDVSPMDMSYYPPNYPQKKMANPALEAPVLRVVYSRPHLQGRELFHEVLKYGEHWRLGANEATELQIFKPVKVNNTALAPGRYSLHCIPQENEWTIAINSVTDVWGLKYDPEKDVVKVQVPVTHGNPPLEYFTMVFEKSETGANLLMAWGDVLAKLPFTF